MYVSYVCKVTIEIFMHNALNVIITSIDQFYHEISKFKYLQFMIGIQLEYCIELFIVFYVL